MIDRNRENACGLYDEWEEGMEDCEAFYDKIQVVLYRSHGRHSEHTGQMLFETAGSSQGNKPSETFDIWSKRVILL